MSKAKAARSAAAATPRLLPSLRALSFVPGPSNIPTAPRALQTRIVPGPVLKAADELFLPDPRRPQHKPELLYSAPRFLHLPRNTTVPEVCLVGRSNVGKSTLINALGGLTSARAGKVTKTLVKHDDAPSAGGASPALAITSPTAGCTQTLNMYGFGPPPPRQPEDDGGDDWLGKEGGRSRSEVREDAKQRAREREESHRHRLYLMDTPGYGLNSRERWGDEILKYFNKRRMLRGAVMLVDSVAGVKDDDRQALMLLRRAGVRTAVVLTKGDKVMRGGGGGDGTADSVAVVERCAQVWEELRAAAAGPGKDWIEGQENGWVREVFVTAAGGQDGFGVSGARLLIGRLAGLLEDVPAEAAVASSETAPKIVSFDDIEVLPERSSPPPSQKVVEAAAPPTPAVVREAPPSPSPQPQPPGQSPDWDWDWDMGFQPDTTKPAKASKASSAAKGKKSSGRSWWEKRKKRENKDKSLAPWDRRKKTPNRRERRAAEKAKAAPPVDPFMQQFASRSGGKSKKGRSGRSGGNSMQKATF